MNVLELFSGSRSFGQEAEKLGYTVFSVDWTNYKNTNLCIDIELLKPDHIPFIPDIIWASPDCTTYTISSISTHRSGTTPKSKYAVKCDFVNKNVLNLIQVYLKINPNLKFYIENPRGMLRKMPFMKNIPRVTVWYCRYGEINAKPTDIFSNNIYSLINPDGWIPKPECYNNNKNCHHEAAPRGSKTGTQGKKNSYEKSKIPKLLCKEILQSCK